jgi:hypothetical protein
MIENNIHLTLFILICYSLPWFLHESKDINKLSNLFSLNSAFLTSCVSILYIFTKNNIYLSLLPNVFIIGLFLDFINNIIYYPEQTDILLTTVIHHPFYIFFTLYMISIDKIELLTYFLIQEIPTIVLNIKRYYNIKNVKIDNLFGITFLVFRILYHLYITYYFKDDIINNKMLLGVCILSFLLHCWWFYGWLKKYFFKKQEKSNFSLKNETLARKKTKKLKI